MTVEGATDSDVFRAYVQEVLCPTLRAGDIVVADNLSPYSPDLNPIEGKRVVFAGHWGGVATRARPGDDATPRPKTNPRVIRGNKKSRGSKTRVMNAFSSHTSHRLGCQGAGGHSVLPGHKTVAHKNEREFSRLFQDFSCEKKAP
jgi:hypothetical protein